MPTLPACLVSAELACYATLRDPHFHAKIFFASLVAATLCVFLLPLVVTGTSSYGAASEVCRDRFSLVRIAMYEDANSPYYDQEWDVDTTYYATEHLLPVHLFHSISTAVSLFGFWVWLFFSPHKMEMSQNLDRTCTTSACTSKLCL